MYVLDSDILTLMLWKGAIPSRLEIRLEQTPPNQLVTTIVNYQEQVGGWVDVVRQKSKNGKLSELIEAYRRMHQQLKLYRRVPLLDFDELTAVRFQELRKQYRRVKANDLRVAAIALVNHATLVTRNLRDFKPILGLTVEDWTKE